MSTLYLLRHAKSSWEEPSLSDHERPLAPRGVRACAVIADHLREQRIAPDLVVCSTAVRTRQTLDRIAGGFAAQPRIEYEPAIYDAPAGALFDLLRKLSGTGARTPAPAADQHAVAGPESVMLIGHQPGIGELALSLAATGDRLADLEAKFPTAALATLEVCGPWPDLAAGSARLAGFVKPSELAGAG